MLRGDWVAGTAYAVGDAVRMLSATYVAITASTNARPYNSPTKWALLGGWPFAPHPLLLIGA